MAYPGYEWCRLLERILLTPGAKITVQEAAPEIILEYGSLKYTAFTIDEAAAREMAIWLAVEERTINKG